MIELQLDLSGVAGRRAAVERSIRSAIRSGRLGAGARMPSSRVLAADLGVSRSTVVAAFEQLSAEGYLVTRPGSATTVAAVHAVEPVDDTPDPMGPRVDHDFRPGEPDVSAFPRAAWQRSARRVVANSADTAFATPDPRGCSELRSSLAEYLSRARTVQVTPGSVRVYGGFGAALGFIAEALLARGVGRVAVEDPGLPFHTEILRIVGITTVRVPVDGDGLTTRSLDDLDVGAVLGTPAHQYPMGVAMSPERRTALVDWARRNDGWIIEDDYDGEFRFDRRPIGALQGLAPDRVIYAGTASKTIAAALRLAWLVVPDGLRDELLAVTHLRAGVSAIEQLTFADFVDCGALDRQVRIMRPRYEHRSRRVCDELAEHAPWLDVAPVAAGMHVVARIADARIDEAEIVRRAAAESIGVLGLRSHHRSRSAPPGIVIGFGRLAEHRFEHSLERLVRVLGALPSLLAAPEPIRKVV